NVINQRIEKLGLRIRDGVDIRIVNQDEVPNYKEYWTFYHGLLERQGMGVEMAQREVRRRSTLIGGLLVRFGEADGLICGTFANY
ncbi:phosphate acyltransferase, partial [Vibrio parahaemolyticus]